MYGDMVAQRMAHGDMVAQRMAHGDIDKEHGIRSETMVNGKLHHNPCNKIKIIFKRPIDKVWKQTQRHFLDHLTQT